MEKSPFPYRLLAGLLIGVGCILPGVSGGVMAVSMGLYRPMLDAVIGFFKAPRKHFAFLLPLALGGLLGLLLGAKALQYAMARWETPMLFLFIGFILGGVPDVMKAADDTGFHRKYLWALGLGVALALPMLLLPPGEGGANASLGPAQLACAGGVYAFGTVVPGISTSFLLIYLGWYQATLGIFAALDIPALLLFGAGFLAVALLTMKAVQWLFDRWQGYACYGVLGFVLVSVGLVFPGFEPGSGLWVDLILLALGLAGGLRMGRLGNGD